MTGRMDDAELQQVMAAAAALTYVPVFEGFGIPILEAFQSGIPVITSNVTSMPEVAGDAAILVDPFDPDAIAQAMESLVKDPQHASELIRRGHARANDFSWDRSAGLLWQCIERALQN